MFKWCLMVAFILAMPVLANEQPKLKLVDSLIDDYLQKYQNEELVTGIGAAFLSGTGVTSTARGYESNKRKKLLTPNAYFQIGSVTKSFTAALILKLEAEGKLNINQTIGDWLYSFGQIHLPEKFKFSKLSFLKRGAGNEIKRRLLGTLIHWL